MLLHAFTTIVSSVVVALAVTFGQAPAAGPEDLNKLTPEQLKAGLERQHPAAYYVLRREAVRNRPGRRGGLSFYAGRCATVPCRGRNEFTSKTAHAATLKGIRDGLGQLRAEIVRSGDRYAPSARRTGSRTPRPK